MISTTIAVAISLFLGLLAVAACVSIMQSVRRGLASGKAILRELAMLDAGHRPAAPVRTSSVRTNLMRSARPISRSSRRAITLQPAVLRSVAA